MDRVVAAEMIGLLDSAQKDLDRVASLAAASIAQGAERSRIVRAVGTILSDIATELWHPIIAEHPDLDPPADRQGQDPL